MHIFYLFSAKNDKIRGMDYQKDYYKVHNTFHSEDAPRKFSELKQLISKEESFRKVVDLGCGGGYVTRLVKKEYNPKENIAVDVSSEAIEHAKSKDKGNTKYKVADAFEFESKETDLVIITDLVEHVENPKKLLEHISTYSKELVVRIPLELTFSNSLFKTLGIKDEYSKFREKYGHLYHYTVTSFLKQLESSNWETESYKVFKVPKRSCFPLELMRLLFYPLYFINPVWAANITGGFLVVRARSRKR